MAPLDETFRYDEEYNPLAYLNMLKLSLGLRGANRLFAMSKTRDPFNRGSAGDFQKARWFREIWEEFGAPDDGETHVHLRRIHFRTCNAERMVPLWDGAPYLNTDQCWKKLQEAFVVARVLRYVDAGEFQDRYNKALPTLNQQASEAGGREDPAFTVEIPSLSGSLPVAQGAYSLPGVVGWTPLPDPDIEVSGYHYDPVLQPNIVEIWSEAEIGSLHRLAERYNCNYVPLKGFASITAVKEMLVRLERSGKAGRILYIADHDPAGAFMSVAVARRCHFACWELEDIAGELAPSIKIDNVAVTRGQIERLNLPRMPIKESDQRKGKFELLHGEGAVEVEAMLALHPGELERIVAERVVELLDMGLASKVSHASQDARKKVRDAAQQIVSERSERLDEVARQASRSTGRALRKVL